MTKSEDMSQKSRSAEEQEIEDEPEAPQEEETENNPGVYRCIELVRKLGMTALVWVRVVARLSGL